MEVEVDAVAQGDVPAVVARERRLDPDPDADGPEQLAEDLPACLLFLVPRGVVGPEQVAGPSAGQDQIGVGGVIRAPAVIFSRSVVMGRSSGGPARASLKPSCRGDRSLRGGDAPGTVPTARDRHAPPIIATVPPVGRAARVAPAPLGRVAVVREPDRHARRRRREEFLGASAPSQGRQRGTVERWSTSRPPATSPESRRSSTRSRSSPSTSSCSRRPSRSP